MRQQRSSSASRTRKSSGSTFDLPIPTESGSISAWSLRRIDEDQLSDGLMFDGSSIAGWKAINESDMILKPDLEAVYVDPFSATPMMILFCNVVDPATGELYARDPRSTATRAEAYLKATGVGDTVFVGPEAEFFMFDDVRFEDGYAGSASSKSTTSNCRPTPAAIMKAATWPTGHAPRAATSLSRRSTAPSRHSRRDGLDDDRDGPALRQASPRSRRRPARARPDLRHVGRDRRPDAGLQICRPHGRPGLRQDRDLHAQADRQG